MATPRQYRNLPIEFKRSIPHPVEAFEIDPDFPYTFRPRLHEANQTIENASWECREDLKKADWKGALAVGCVNEISGNFGAATFPEGKLDRVIPMTYVSEYAFIHDEMVDEKDTPEEFEKAHQTMHSFIGKDHHDRSNSMIKNIQARMALQIYQGDHDGASQFFEVYRPFLEIKSPQRDSKSYKTLDDYLVWRFLDAGGWIFKEMLFYTADVNLNNDEISSLKPVILPVLQAMVLTNDYYSWDKEYKEYNRTNGSMPMVNAVWLLKHLHDVDNTKARGLLREKILDLEMQYCNIRDEYLRTQTTSPDTIRFFGLIELAVAGNRFWHATSKRYNSWAPTPVSKTKTKRSASQIEAIDFDGERDSKRSKIELDQIASNNDVSFAKTPESLEVKTPDTNGNFDSSSFSQNGADKIVLEPYKYISSLPASNSRNALLDALNCWYFVPHESLEIIRHVIGIIHNTSLILDDIEDNSPTRRGCPSAHEVFGISQAINSATYQYVKCLEFVMALSKESIHCFTHTLSQLHIGQSQDLHWTFHCKCPSLEEYFKQTEDKTGGLFRMAAGMMRAEATKNRDVDADILMRKLGKYYQLRDDYNDLISNTKEEDKNLDTVYNDLDQGSFTLPIIHALEKEAENGDAKLLNILRSRKLNERKMSSEMKKLAISEMENMGSFTYAKALLNDLHVDIEHELRMLEKRAESRENWILRLMLYRLKVT
ncbi:putative geranylgeranyl pyrophosphate synthetase protein [Botrytis fragariae]|uniref:Putative geranylgeranyl pyrophosphate synthetase protein n=1 Tax=Botrytis fragariae TaxID=1964551 RepID=A0A8H6EJB9_9HELO|nr:putative geranylgeranyl pyrophosphate synthetase protein [Botrytis fragariae]KAF5874334.1 putative geranylgeranyl pyrophosphate synthetase protein [Botrytis fragariae]